MSLRRFVALVLIGWMGFFASTSLAASTLKIENFYPKNEQAIQYVSNRFYFIFSATEDFEGRISISYNINNKEVFLLQDELIKVIGGQTSGMFVDGSFPFAGDIDLNVKVSDRNNPGVVIESKEKVSILADTDKDGQPNVTDMDDDNDSITDVDELANNTNPLLADTDHDGVSDSKDIFPLDPKESGDHDKDGIGDVADPDDDNDGLSDVEEKKINSDPFLSDTDQDGLSDSAEVDKGTDPLKGDTDQDGVSDIFDPFPLDNTKKADSDSDGIADEDELKAGSDPLQKDADKDNDKDGLNNYDEIIKFHTNPNNPDSDGDQIKDGDEIKYGLDPNLKTDGEMDKDGDGVTNVKEISLGSDLNNTKTYGINDSAYKILHDYGVIVILIGAVAIIFLYKRKQIAKLK